jgi:histidyl-tRNA synthetase
MQKVWRGERPAQGRFREFYQCDIDIVGIEQLPLSFDAELLEAMGAVFVALDCGKVILKCNHRKILQGFYEGLGLAQDVQSQVLIEVDKLEKVGSGVVQTRLTELGVTQEKIEKILKLATSCFGIEGLESHLNSFGIESELFQEGVRELVEVMSSVPQREGIELIWDGSIARGLNYYTGVIFETTLEGSEELGSICSGGRYEDLCARFSKTRMPGVGISLGLTRLLSHILAKKELEKGLSKEHVLLICMSVDQRAELKQLATEMRELGWKVELTPVGKLKKLMNYANKKGHPQVIIPNEDGSFEWKDMLSGEQQSLERVALLQKKI